MLELEPLVASRHRLTAETLQPIEDQELCENTNLKKLKTGWGALELAKMLGREHLCFSLKARFRKDFLF